MRRRTILAAACFTSLTLSACAGGALVAATGPDDASDPTAAYDVAEAKPRTDQKPSASGTNTPPVFPPDYRSRIARALLAEYVGMSKGPPEITGPQWRPITGYVSVCVGFPVAMLYGLVDATRKRRWVIFAVPESGSPGRFAFKKRELGNLDRCENEGEMKPFTELAQVGDPLKACHARGERSCTVYSGPAGKDPAVKPSPAR